MADLVRVARLLHDSIVDGPDLRLAVFVQGCSRRCEGCHNPETHDPLGGTPMTVDDIWRHIAANPLLGGVTLTGGEPFEQPVPLTALARRARAAGLSVWAYTGFQFEELLGDPGRALLLEQIDVLVDGAFELSRRSLSLRWRGSANQRLLDVPACLRAGRPVLLTDDT